MSREDRNSGPDPGRALPARAGADSPVDQFAAQLRRLHVAADAPTHEYLQGRIREKGSSLAFSPQAWSDWLRGKTLPSDQRLVMLIADHLHDRATRRGRPALNARQLLLLLTRAKNTKRADRGTATTPGPAPIRVGTVPRPADHFRSRAAAGDVETAVTETVTGLLSGMGGVGKTQLAADLADRLWQDGRLDLLVWVPAASRQSIVGTYAQAAADLAITGAAGADTERDAARFHAWLAGTDRRWLVVLDDLTAVSDLRHLWPPSSPYGRTLVTTRLRAPVLHGADRHLIQIDPFTEDEAGAYLSERLTGDDPDLPRLAADLGHLPLALAQAAAFMLNERVPCAEYRRRFADRRNRLDDLVPDPDDPSGMPDDYLLTVAATLSLSIEAADAVRPAGLARPLAELASVLDPAGIPEPVLTTTAARNWLSARRQRDTEIETVRSGLQVLHRLNVANVVPGSVTVHTLVQRATRDTLTEDDLAGVAWAAADALLESWPAVERDAGHGRRLRANADVVRRRGGDGLLAPDPHQLPHLLTRSLGESGNPAGAATLLDGLRADASRLLGPDHPVTLVFAHDLAGWRGRSGPSAEAVEAFEHHLAETVRIRGPQHLDTFITRGNLARSRGEAGDPAAAVDGFERLLADVERVLGTEDQYTLVTRGNLAKWRGHAGDPAAAAGAYPGLVDDFVRILGPDHQYTLTTRLDFATWLGQAGDHEGSVAAFERLRAEVVRVLGPDHPYSLTARHGLATELDLAGEPGQAVGVFEDLLADQLRVLGPDHPDTLATRNNLANALGRTGQAGAAAAALERLLADVRRVFGPRHPHAAAVEQAIGQWRRHTGRTPE